jgi:tetratricopeptide (TPR) repeat protein
MRISIPLAQALVLGALLAGPGAWADGGGGSGGGSNDTDAKTQPDWLAGVAAINDKRWPAAIAAMRRFLVSNHNDADGHNWLAYAYRNSGRLDDAFRHYQRALALDPRHLGAHEYIGEAYLQVGKTEEARKHLKRLAELCSASCEQYRDLEQALAAHDAKSAKK